MSVDRMGRLSRPPHPLLSELFYAPHLEEDQREVLPHLLRIDAAHVVMLAERGLLTEARAAALLSVNEELRQRVEAGRPAFETPATHRGLFWLYEREYISRLGEEVGGAAHLARSRNDINATVTRLRVRDGALALLASCAELLATVATAAEAHAATLMSCFTHLQPAQPSTLGHYLTGVLAELLRTAEWLLAALAALDRSPMGAAAGAGTSFPIDPSRVARLLGFGGAVENAADAVASRDYVVQVLSAAAMLGTTLTRLAGDLQAWASAAYGFLDWPDDLVSTSSIMPQKRNAFVLESLRGEAVQAAGALVNALLGLKNTPFSNAIEVSAGASAQALPALAATEKAVRLTALLVGRLEVNPERMKEFLAGTQATMTALADFLVARHGLSFRTAHELVGSLLARRPEGLTAGLPEEGLLAANREDPADLRQTAAPPAASSLRAGEKPPTGQAPLAHLGCFKSELEAALSKLAGRPVTLAEEELAAVLDGEEVMRAAAHGGGPAPGAVRSQLGALGHRVAAVREALASWQGRLLVAREELTQAVRRLAGAAQGTAAAAAHQVLPEAPAPPGEDGH